MMFYTNSNKEEFNRFLEFYQQTASELISEAEYCFLDLENIIFEDKAVSSMNFINHNLNVRELNDKFNRLLQHFSIYEQANPGSKQFRSLAIRLVEIKSNYNDDLFRWSYYNHKFAASQGQDQIAMNEWHKLEQKIDVNRIAQFKARRENTLTHYLHIAKNFQFFDEIIISRVHPRIHSETKFGLDIAEEQYLSKIIKENNAEKVMKLIPYHLDNSILNLTHMMMRKKKLKLSGHILSNSKKMNPFLLLQLRDLFNYLDIKETGIDQADFVFLINDMDTVNELPEVDSDKPVFVADLSIPSTPNFGYLLLKDEGFDQVFSYAKRQSSEASIDTFVRSLYLGLTYFIAGRTFNEGIAVNYMEDFFVQLSSSLNKSLKDFSGPIDMLTSKLQEA